METEPSVGPLEQGQSHQFGPYKVLRLLGRGGMGAVYLAEQQYPIRRLVALKVIKPGMDTGEVIARFESERQALVLMDHPNIARVFDAGSGNDGRPYFAMEYVSGIPITEYCDQNRLTNRERLELFLPVCQAVQHAHQKGIIHRDIKPSNVLVSVQDGVAVPKVIDFGVAKAINQKLVEETFFTEHGILIGTPEYMSPEQIGVENVDTTTDIYSLGTLLYELLVGALPFDPKALREAGYDEMKRIIRQEETPLPTARLRGLGAKTAEIAMRRRTDPEGLERQLRGDLNWITARAMRKERRHRYASASELAADIDRHLRDEPVLASPPGAVYRASKFVRKHRGKVAGTLAAFLILVLSVLLTSVVNLANQMQREFDVILERAYNLEALATRMVSQSLNRQRSKSLREALRDPDLQNLLVEVMSVSHAIVEIAVVDPNNEILLDSDPRQLGFFLQPLPNFAPLVNSRSWYELLRVLLGKVKRNYQLEQPIGTAAKPFLYVRPIIDPALFRDDVNPALRPKVVGALLLVILAICFTSLLCISLLCFRK